MSQHSTDRTIEIPRVEIEDGRLRKAHASLIVLKGAEIGRDFRLRRRGEMIIGRGPEVEIRLSDVAASRRHACVECSWSDSERRAVFHVRDLQSTNRTFLNSRPVDRAELVDGDKIRVGGTVMKFVLLDDIEAAFHAEVRDRITYDQLTGLLTKESLFLALEPELRRCLSYDLPLSVLMMDLDYFKEVNDGNGHLMGSHVLAEVGCLIRETVRVADVSARYGGEEFTSYLVDTDIARAALVAERIRAAIARHRFTRDNVTARITISIGIAMLPQHGRTIEQLIGAADRALYRAKAAGRNRVCLADIRD